MQVAIGKAGPQTFFGFVYGPAGIADYYDGRQAVGDMALGRHQKGIAAGFINYAPDGFSHVPIIKYSSLKENC
jgi:hypothetical protein